MANTAIKLQWAIDSPGEFDRTAGEPTEPHGTIAEIDPATPEQEAIAAQIFELMKQLPLKSRLFGHTAALEIRKMQSDGRV